MTGKELKEFLRLIDVGPKALAGALGVTRQTVYRWMTLEQIPKMAHYSILWVYKERIDDLR